MEDQIKAALDDIRSYLQSHGGDVEFVEYTEGIVKVRLQGACQGCAGAQMTIKNGIERILKEQFPNDVKGVEGVN